MHLPCTFVSSLSPGSTQPCGSCSYGGSGKTVGSKRLSFNTKRKLWTLLFVLALLKTGLDLLHGETDKEETQGQPSTLINHLATSQSPMRGSLECHPCHQQYYHHPKGFSCQGYIGPYVAKCSSQFLALTLFELSATLCTVEHSFLK